MASGKDFFAMTKRERRGTIAVLLVIVVLLVISFVLNQSKPSVPNEIKTSEMLLFEKDADSVRLTTSGHRVAPKPRAAKSKNRKKRRQPSREEKPKKHPRNVDPLPQF